MRRWSFVFALVVTALAGRLAAEKLTYVDLIGRMTDLERLAVLPEAGETCAQWSSYDRASVYDAAAGEYVKWEANGDGNGRIRMEGKNQVLAEMDGPGVIWRIWSAMPEKGHVKFYLDGAEAPAIDLPFIGLFDHTNAPFNRPSLVYMAARGQNCYVPIPYQKSCKIVAEEGWGRYFQFTYTTFPKGTVVPTFKMELSEAESAALNEADAILGRGGADPWGKERKRAMVMAKKGTFAPGAALEMTLNGKAGPQAITGLVVRTAFADRNDEIGALRELVLRITWDDEETAAVWCPLGDFFGTAPGENLYKSFPLGMTEKGYYSNWYMPFAERARIEIVNEGKKPRTLELEVTRSPVERPIAELGRFHAKWHRGAFQPEDPKRWPDWTILTTKGRGRFCGVMLHVWNPKGGQCPLVAWCHGHYWWGEGDEKFFVDGEKFPSTFGTGTEDYFGYAWGSGELFAQAYHNQTISMGNKGHISVNRFQIVDNIPFQTSFEGAIEKYFPDSWPTLYAATVWWYQAAGAGDPYGAVPVEERTGYYVKPQVFKVKGAIEGETMKVLSKSAGNPRRQDLAAHGNTWSDEAHLWWTDAKPGDTLELAVPVAEAGTYTLTTQLTKAVDYGIVQLYLDGTKLGEPLDLYNDGVVATGAIDLGKHELSKGEHVLKVEITGANEKAKKAYMFGIDYVKLEQ
ncbi:MAG: DUF2961 domain-containing protein [Phycisphaerae bacterium]|nr:DUF2961 domain-containing protein [Phycisphaerae bacterium]